MSNRLTLILLGLLAVGVSACAAAGDDERSDLDLARELGRRAGLAVDNARLYKDSQQALRDREQALAELKGIDAAYPLALKQLQQNEK